MKLKSLRSSIPILLEFCTLAINNDSIWDSAFYPLQTLNAYKQRKRGQKIPSLMTD